MCILSSIMGACLCTSCIIKQSINIIQNYANASEPPNMSESVMCVTEHGHQAERERETCALGFRGAED